jgi:hypothetical protein
MITDPKIIEKIKNSNAKIVSVGLEEFKKMIQGKQEFQQKANKNTISEAETNHNRYKTDPPPSIDIPTKIEIKMSPGKGLGVFAKEKIQMGEIIETCPLISISKEGDILPDHRFLYPKNTIEEYVIVLGYGSMYNHSNNPNADWKNHPEYKAFNFIAIKDIEVGEEICTYYGGEGYWNARKNINVI